MMSIQPPRRYQIPTHLNTPDKIDLPLLGSRSPSRCDKASVLSWEVVSSIRAGNNRLTWLALRDRCSIG